MVNGTSLALGSVAGSGAIGGGRTMGAELMSTITGGFLESDRGRFGEEVLG